MNPSRSFVDSFTAEAQSCFKVAAVFPFVLRAATGCSACCGAAWIWMVFISHLKQETRHKLILSLYLYIVQDAIPRYSADDSLLTGTVQQVLLSLLYILCPIYQVGHTFILTGSKMVVTHFDAKLCSAS